MKWSNFLTKKDPTKETIIDARNKMPKRYEKDTKKDAKKAKKDGIIRRKEKQVIILISK